MSRSLMASRGWGIAGRRRRVRVSHMVSKITSIRANASRSLSEKLNHSAYGYYNTTVVDLSKRKMVTSKAKHLAAAALLSSSSILILGNPASAATICTPATTNGATITCAGPPTNSIASFSGDNLTITATSAFDFDSTAVSIGARRVNSGIYISGSGGTIHHSGTIITGEVAEGPGGPYGRHNGLYIIGGTGDVYAENTAIGTITTTAYESAGIQVSATTGTSKAVNRGSITTTASDSYGVASANANIAISQNFGTVTTQGYQSQGVYSYTQSTTGSATSSNASGATVNIAGNLTAGVISIAHAGNGTATASSAGTINVTGDHSTGGVAAIAVTGAASATNTGAINLQSTVIDMGRNVGYADAGVFSASHTASSTNGMGGSIVDTGAGTSIGIYATTAPINPFVGPVMVGMIAPGGTATGTNDGTISLVGTYSVGMSVNGIGGTSTASNSGTVTVTGDRTTGIRTYGSTTNVNNTGTVTVTGQYSFGVTASSVSVATTNITNSGTITQSYGNVMIPAGPGMGPRSYSTGIIASGPTVNITNTSTGTVSGAHTAIRAGYSNAVTIINAGTLNGHVYGPLKFKRPYMSMTVPTFALTNTGTINGFVAPGSGFVSTIVNNGGTIGNGTYATLTGRGDDVITITGSGNVINGAFRDDGGSGAGNNAINFNQSDTLTLNGASRGYALFGFETANFNSGTTVIAQERGIGTFNYAGTSRVNVNAGATLSTTSMALGINTNQLTVSGTGTTRGTLQAPAGSTIAVTGDATFNDKGRFTPGIASDTSAGLLTAANVTFNAGSEVYADVTRGIELTSGNASRVATATTAITDNGLSVYDNSILFSFTHEIRTGNELYLIAKRELRAVTATDNNNGRTPAQNIAGAIDAFIDSAPSNNPIVAYLAQFPVAEQEARLFQLVKDSLPEEAGATGASAVASADMVLDLIMGRLANGSLASAGSASGVSAGEQLLGGTGSWAIWGQASASFADYNPAVINGFESDTYAMSGGIDGDVSDDLRLGLSLFYSNTTVDETGAGANSAQDIEGVGALLYGTYRPEAFYVNGTLGLGVNEFESARNSLGGVNRADYDGYQIISSFELGKAFTEGNWELSPHIGARFNYVAIEGFTETGPLPTSVGSQNITSLRGLLGLSGRYTHEMDSGSKLIPEGYVRAIREMADPNGAITGSVVGGGTFISQTAARDNLSYALGAGMTYEMDNSLSVRFLYEGEYQEDYQEHSFSAAVRFQF